MKHSQKAVELEPESAGYLDTLAEINFRKGNRDKALELMKKCSEMDKNNGYYQAVGTVQESTVQQPNS